MIAKYFATSFAIENVVSEPRVMSSCFPISTTSMSFVGFESRSIMLPASFAACVPVFIATPTSACASAGRVVRAVARHRDEPAAGLLALDQRHLVFRLRLGEEVVDAGFLRDRRRGERVVARDHHRANAHRAQPVEALADAALHDVLEVDDAEHARAVAIRRSAFSATTSGVPPSIATRSIVVSRSGGIVPPCSRTQRSTASPAPFRTW